MEMVGDDAAVKRCPRCAEEIRREATMCRHCLLPLEDPPSGEFISRWIQANPALTASLATFLYVVFQIYKSGEFEVNTTVELLRAGGITSILVGVLLVQLPVELVLLCLVGCWWLIGVAPARRVAAPAGAGRWPRLTTGDARSTPLVLIGAVLVLSFYTNPWPFFLLSVGVAAVAVALAFRPGGGGRAAGHTRRVIAVLVGLAFLILVQRPTTWAPSESITTEDQRTIVGYVVADDGKWTTVLTPRWTGRLTPGDNSVRRIPTESITRREPCALEFLEARLFDQVLRLRPAQLPGVLRDGALPRPLTPPCP